MVDRCSVEQVANGWLACSRKQVANCANFRELIGVIRGNCVQGLSASVFIRVHSCPSVVKRLPPENKFGNTAQMNQIPARRTHNDSMRNYLLISILIAAAIRAAASPSPDLPAAPQGTNAALAVYDPDPNHLWNRVFSTFYQQHIEIRFVGSTNNNSFATNPPPTQLWVGPDVVDPPIFRSPNLIVDQREFVRCNAVLEEFLQQHGERLIRDPVKRAVFQRDLWAVFDIVQSDENTSWTSRQKRRETMGRNLAQIMSSVALTRAEIEALPNTFRDAIASEAFSSEPNRGQYNLLATDLLNPQSDWIEMTPNGQFFHAGLVSDRSVFRIFIKAPPDSPVARAVLEWQKKIVEARQLREKNSGQTVDDPPAPTLDFLRPLREGTNVIYAGSIPIGTRLVLLREMLCIDADGLVRPTHIVESVQMRGFVMQGTNQLRYARELELSRKLLFQHSQGGLRPIVRDELRAENYSSLGSLQTTQKALLMRPFPDNCAQCHTAVNSLFSAANIRVARDPNETIARTIAGKVSRADYLQLREWLPGASKP
jgi:hypothetical protein